ncbi:hypothetical protein [Gimesia sp.]|uniref:hypothetical protein n=1 Tax=Gimesia sp. TaxID=2024833 RepID=UPI0032ED713C
MPTFVCNFCGGDHGTTTCNETVSYQGQEDCAAEVLDSMLDFLGFELSSKQWEQVRENHDNDQPVEMLAYIVEHFSDSFNDDEIKKYFAPVTKDDGKIYNASRKHGSCFEFAYKALLRGVGEELDDGELVLVHGFVLTNSTEYTGHAWLETDNHAIDCGAMTKEFDLRDKKAFYKHAKVKSPKKFTRSEAANKFIELEYFGPWVEVPDDLPMCSAWSK